MGKGSNMIMPSAKRFSIFFTALIAVGIVLFPPIQGYYWFPPGAQGADCSFVRFNNRKIISYSLFRQQGETDSEGRLGNVELWEMGTYYRSSWNTIEIRVLLKGGG